MLDAAELEFVPCSDLFLEALGVFEEQGDVGLSFVESALIAIARRTGAEHIATFDRDFEALAEIAVVPGSSPNL